MLEFDRQDVAIVRRVRLQWRQHLDVQNFRRARQDGSRMGAEAADK